MIAEIVTFRHPEGTTREQAEASAMSVIPFWQQNPHLVRKHFLWQEDGSAAGFYLWTSREAAQAAHSPEWIAKKELETGGKVQIQYYEVTTILDNRAGSVETFHGAL